MNDETMKKIEKLLSEIPITDENIDKVDQIKDYMEENNYVEALKVIEGIISTTKKIKQETLLQELNKEPEGVYPQVLSNKELERKFVGLLLQNPKYISKFYFLYDDCKFEDPEIENIYKSVIFTEGRIIQLRIGQKRI